MFYGRKSLLDQPPEADIASDSESDIPDADEYEQGEDLNENTDGNVGGESENDETEREEEIGRDKCTVWRTERPKTRRNVRQNVLREKSGVHPSVPTHTAWSTL